jgi:predicted RNA-binding protein YlxR (DUF448 family)
MKKIFIRTCVVCGEKKDKSELMRLTLMDNRVVIDFKGRMGGRGSYVCKNFECISKLEEKHLERSFKKKIVFDIDLKKQLKMGVTNG